MRVSPKQGVAVPMWFFRVCISLAVVVATTAQAQGAAGHDAAIFASLVRALAADTGFARGGGLQVDPHPPTEGNSTQGRVPSGSRDAVVTTRTEALRGLHIRIGEATRPDACAGIMVPYSPSDQHRGCPKQSKMVASVGAARGSEDGLDPAFTHAATVGVTVLEVGPTGFSALHFEYTLKFVDSTWRVLNRRLVRFVE